MSENTNSNTNHTNSNYSNLNTNKNTGYKENFGAKIKTNNIIN